ncbi:hypothetical protein FRC10_004630 [Ceratobasidium sp. 414]|nr:hypothetical protein FRC10_004630 [Ceratobasidium sp. 414]
MSGNVNEGYRDLGPNLPNMELDLDAPPTLPSSRSYESWAASCPELYLNFEARGEAIHSRAKRCTFCGGLVRCPTSDQSLVEHMKSVACKRVQRELEALIRTTVETEPDPIVSAAAPSIPTFDMSQNPSSSTSDIAYTPPPYLSACEGAELALPDSSVWGNYLWHLHDPSNIESSRIPFYVCSINRAGNVIRVRSHLCTIVEAQLGSKSCNACIEQLHSRELAKLVQYMTTEDPAHGLNRKYYSYKQKDDLLDAQDLALKRYRLKGLELNRHAKRLLGKLNDHKQLMLTLTESDGIAVARLVRVALRQGCGVMAIVDRLVKAQQGLYHCQSYSKKELDVSLLVLRLGGPRLLFAMEKALDLPGEYTVRRRAERLYLRPSIGFPTAAEVAFNIKSICGPARDVVPYLRGYTLMIDELASEENARYSIAGGALVGLCREHASINDLKNMTGRPISHLEDIKKLLDSGELHRAKEATVVALAPFGYSSYSPMVVLISGTCKTESVLNQRNLISLVVDGWKVSPHGELALGPIWSIATDGDARRRRAIHSLCMSHELPKDSALYQELCHLDMLNLSCGEGAITHDGDFKHEEKRLAAALRSGTGIFVNGTHISTSLIKQHLRNLPGMSPAQIEYLFNNDDRQSVPKAHTLLKGIYDASQLPEVQCDTASRPFVLLGEFLHSFYAPQTIPSLSLPQQVACMAKCAFLLFMIFRSDKTGFISSQLYYDIQASVKNAMFCIAKTKLLNSSLPFYLLQLGDDRLEGMFGIYRTSTNNRNLDLLQMSERASAVQEVDKVFAENPSYDRKPYRLSLEGVSGVDHLNPASWRGDVCVGNFVLRSAWVEGRTRAEEVLRQARMVPDFDREALSYSAGRLEVDLMRPFGRYVGVTEVDIEDDDVIPSIFVQGDDNFADSTDSAGPLPDSSEFNPVPGLAHSDLGELSEEFSTEELPLEHQLPPCMPAPEDDLVQISDSSLRRGWVNVDSTWVHLESATRLILGTDSREKSTDRLRRVCGFSRYPSVDSQSDSILGDLCLIGQLVLALVRVNTEIALAVVRVSSIKVGPTNSRVEAISLDHLSRPDVTLTGQVLGLEYEEGVWYWNKTYILLNQKAGVDSSTPTSRDAKPMLVKFQAPAI